MPPGKLRGNGRFLGFGYALVSASDRTLWGWTRELKTEKTAGSAAGGALQTASRLGGCSPRGAYEFRTDTRVPVSAARLTASITLRVSSPSRPLTTGSVVARITPQKLAICRASGSSFA